MNEASDIFGRKFTLIQDQVNSLMEKVEEDKQFQQELMLLRKQEVEMMVNETDKFFGQETQLRKDAEKNLSG